MIGLIIQREWGRQEKKKLMIQRFQAKKFMIVISTICVADRNLVVVD